MQIFTKIKEWREREMRKTFGIWAFLVFCIFPSWGATIFVADGGRGAPHSNDDTVSAEKMTAAELDDLDSDPFESLNRKIFYFNEIVDGILLDPFANMYKMWTPISIQKGLSHGLSNLMEPLTMANDCLQAKGSKALESLSRFLINTVFGLGGIFDVADSLGLESHKETFNTTLKYWGVPPGPYIILPVLGPANPRFLVGLGVDYIIDPVRYYLQRIGENDLIWVRYGLTVLTTRAEITQDLKNFRENSVDSYASVRSFYKQYMNAERGADGEIISKSPSLDEFMFEDEDKNAGNS
jgi:phospholipid-binding lipoprotein MlaA